MPLGGPGGEVIRVELSSRHVHLSGHVGDGVAGQLVSAAREPAPPQQELQVQSKAEPGRSGLVAQLVHLVTDKGEVIDHLVQAQVANTAFPLGWRRRRGSTSTPM